MMLAELLVAAEKHPILRAVQFASGGEVLSAEFFPSRPAVAPDDAPPEMPPATCSCGHDPASEHNPQTGACFFGCDDCARK